MKKIVGLSTLFALTAASSAHAAGISADVQAARATGMATAVTAMIDDASGIFYNPAGIARGKGIEAEVNGTLIMPTITFKSALTGNSTTTPFTPIPPAQMYAAIGITDHLSAGIGVFEPYGLTVKWPDAWEGRSQITYAALATYYANPTIAYNLGALRIGGGVQVVYSTVDIQRDLALPSGVFGKTELGGDAWGIGGNVGLQIDAVPDVLSFGAHYRSAVALDYSGNAQFANIPPEFSGTLHDQAIKSRFVMPDTFQFGVAVRPIPKLVIDLDVVYFGWNHFQSIDINFPNDTTGSLSQSQPKNWSSNVQVHLGTEYIINDTWAIRGGAMYDPTPSPENTITPELPDANRVNIAIGGSWHNPSGFYVDLAYEAVILIPQDSTAPQFPGTYSGFANVAALTVGYSTPKLAKHPK